MKMRKKLRAAASGHARMWDALPWKAVDTDSGKLGDFDDSVFFGLEEIDGNAYKLSKSGVTALTAEPVIDTNEDVSEHVDADVDASIGATIVAKKTKKDKKRKQSEVAEETVAVEKDTAVEEPSVVLVEEDSSKSKKNKKSKKEPKAEAKAEVAHDGLMDIDEVVNATDSGKLGSLKALYINAPAPLLREDVAYLKEDSEWAPGLRLSDILTRALLELGFQTPTPIQTAAIPLTTAGGTDIVGAAETGSGKTLAFSLPIIHSLLRNWDSCSNLRIPHALIIAPTRELALQISTVIREVCVKVQQICAQYQATRSADVATSDTPMDSAEDNAVVTTEPVKLSKKAKKALNKKNKKNAAASGALPLAKVCIEIVSIVGGMSEQKQRRQLAGRGKPVHIVVATPGRLCEMFEDADNVSFQDMSRLKFLVVDEADRIMEEGHYAELHRVFSRIRDHEEIRERGEDPLTVIKARQLGTTEDPDADLADTEHSHSKAGQDSSDLIEDLDAGEVDVPMMPTEEEIRQAQEECARMGADEYYRDAALYDTEEQTAAADGSQGAGAIEVGTRQTLLFSATAIQNTQNTNTAGFDKKAKLGKKLKLKGTLKGINQNNQLPDHLKQLLAQVGIQKSIHVVDVTTGIPHKKAVDGTEAESAAPAGAALKEGVHKLPEGLTQEELHVPTDEKDVYAYYYLNKYPGRSLVFVNSIKTARRLDGLLRALGLNCRTLHAQLQQKQRLNALESFSNLPVGVLVATDVAARGLDIAKIQSVIHYDAARSPQVYVHRSGRTARANTTGTTVSLVSPEDAAHHRAICTYLGMKALPLLQVDLYSLPMLRQRVALAKKIFLESFVASQQSKDKHWLTQSCKDADLELDDHMYNEIVGESAEDPNHDAVKQKEAMSKKAISAAKQQLQGLLDAPLPDARTYNNVSRKRARVQHRGGKLSKADAAVAVSGGSVASMPKKGKNKAAPVVEDSSWKRRGSFFVFAK